MVKFMMWLCGELLSPDFCYGVVCVVVAWFVVFKDSHGAIVVVSGEL